MGEAMDCQMSCASGSRDKQNNIGRSGHPCLVPCCEVNGGEIMSPVRTLAKGERYSVLIIAIKLCQNPKCCNTAWIYSHSSLSKAISVSSENTAHGFE